MADNFSFLELPFPSLANLGQLAEKYRESDPNSSIMKMGMLGENIVSMMMKFDHVQEPYENTAVKRIDALSREGLLPKDVQDILHLVRQARNKAAHQGWGDAETATQFLPVVHSLAGWFAQTYGPLDLEIPTYSTKQQLSESALISEDKTAELKEADEVKAELAEPISKDQRTKRAVQAANQRPKTEAETRLLIDEQLRLVGWDADTAKVRFSEGTRPEKGKNLAIAEWPTDSSVGRNGRADYALFIGESLVGIIEAKAEHSDIPSVLDYQAKEYARCIKSEHLELTFGRWGDFKVPFLFCDKRQAIFDATGNKVRRMVSGCTRKPEHSAGFERLAKSRRLASTSR